MTYDLAVIIVAWNVRDLLVACLQSVYADADRARLATEVWVVDNASTDGTAATVKSRFPKAHVLEPGSNLGFARGNNRALRALGAADGPEYPPFVLLLNPDTVVKPGALAALIEAMNSSGAGIAGARLVYGDGSFQHSGYAFPGLTQLVIDLFPVPGRLVESRLNGRYPRRLYAGTDPFPVDHPLGATFMLRREVIAQTGLLDEQFQLYCEEIDWAIRIKKAGWKAICAPKAEIVHYGGMSTGQVRPQAIVQLWTARLQLYRKHYHPLRRGLAKVIMRAGMNRLIQQTARDSSLDDDSAKALVDAYREVIRLTYRL